MSGALTKPQKRAMHAFLWRSGREGFDDEACDAVIWDVGVRPWPTMDNLAAKGLIICDGWFGPDEGHNWRLTEQGREFMRALVAEREAS